MYHHARNGADAVLLIASVLPNKDLSLMLKVASTVGLQCLIEVRWWASRCKLLTFSPAHGTGAIADAVSMTTGAHHWGA